MSASTSWPVAEIAYIHTIKNPRRAELVRGERVRRPGIRVFESVDGEDDWDAVVALLHAERIRVHAMPRNVRGKYGRWASLILVWRYMLQQRVPCLAVIEDDVRLPDDFEAKLALLLERLDLRREIGKLGPWGEGRVFSREMAAEILDKLREHGIDDHSDMWLRRHCALREAPILTATVPTNARSGHIWHTSAVQPHELLPPVADTAAASPPAAGYFRSRDDLALAACVRSALLTGTRKRRLAADARRVAVDPRDVTHVYFRACDRVAALNGKPRPFGFDKPELIQLCFRSLLDALACVPHRITVVGDRLSPGTLAFFRRFPVEIIDEDLGPGGSVMRCLDLALALPDDAWVYFCEDDYLHRADAFEAIGDLVENRAAILRHRPRPRWKRLIAGAVEKRPLFIYPADQPTMYRPKRRRPSLLFRSSHAHWRQLTVAPFTFLTQAGSLRRFQRPWRRYGVTNGDRSLSRAIYADGWFHGRALCIAPIPALATHMHVGTMSPGYDWARRIAELLPPRSPASSVTQPEASGTVQPGVPPSPTRAGSDQILHA